MKAFTLSAFTVTALLAASATVRAEADGSKILLQEAERAKEVQRLQYQAELLKQKAEIAKYVDQIKKSGGDLSDLGIDNAPTRVTPRRNSSASARPAPVVRASTIPTLLNIDNDRATFQTSQGKVQGKVGQTLPGGYRILSVDMRDGVGLLKNGMKYNVDIDW